MRKAYILILAVLLTTSCDLLCRMAGRPTKAEVAAKRVEVALAKAAAQAAADSLAAAQAAADSLSATLPDDSSAATPEAVEEPGYQYYIVVGSFKSEGNAKWQASRVQKAGFDAFVREYRGGDYYNVLAGGCNDYGQAVETRKALLELSFIPRESWILNDKK